MPRPSNVAWGVLGASVAVYEYYAPDNELLSNAVDRALERPIGRVLVAGAIGATALHLLNLLPERYDPYHYLAKLKSTT